MTRHSQFKQKCQNKLEMHGVVWLSGDVITYIIELVVFIPANSEDLKQAVRLWFSDPNLGLRQFGLIGCWDTRQVTDMSDLFAHCVFFNEQLYWDTSNVTNMSRMFYECRNYDQPINLDTRNVTDMICMFFDCHKFNQPITLDTRNVTDMNNMIFTVW